jgi:hypothetical protein
MSNESASPATPPAPEATEPQAAEPLAAERQAAESQAAEPQATVISAQVSLRRAPKYSVFLVLGALIGAIVTLIVTALFPVDPDIGFAALYGYFVLYGIPIGIVLGALVAFAFDRRSSKHAREMTAEQTTVDPLPAEATIEPESDDSSAETSATEPSAPQGPTAA